MNSISWAEFLRIRAEHEKSPANAGLLRSAADHIDNLHAALDSVGKEFDVRLAAILPIISNHAIQKFRHLCATNESPEEVIKLKIYTLLTNAKPVRLKRQWRVRQLAAHEGKPARYYMSKGKIIVMCGNVIVTIHNGEAGRWEAA